MKAHILVVEDDTVLRITLARLLEYAGYQVSQAADGEAAIDVLEQDVFDVVVTDMVMGAIDGIEVLHTARLQPYCPHVILLTGHGTLETAIAALRAGAYDYLLKPCSDEELINSVERAAEQHAEDSDLRDAAAMIKDIYDRRQGIRQPESHPGALTETSPSVTSTASTAAPLQVGELMIGETRHNVTFQGEPLAVTPIEYAMLRLMAENSGETCTYREIVQRTHRFEAEEAEAQMLVKQHVRNLRKKLGAGYLVNSRGTGYKLLNPDDAG